MIDEIENERGADQRLDAAVSPGAQHHIGIEQTSKHLAPGAPHDAHSTLPGLRMPFGSSVRLSVFINS